MTAEQNKIFMETQGLLAGCGCHLVRASADEYFIERNGSNEVLGSGTLDVIYNVAIYMSGSGRFEPEHVVSGPEAYQAGRKMAEKLNQGK